MGKMKDGKLIFLVDKIFTNLIHPSIITIAVISLLHILPHRCIANCLLHYNKLLLIIIAQL